MLTEERLQEIRGRHADPQFVIDRDARVIALQGDVEALLCEVTRRQEEEAALDPSGRPRGGFMSEAERLAIRRRMNDPKATKAQLRADLCELALQEDKLRTLVEGAGSLHLGDGYAVIAYTDRDGTTYYGAARWGRFVPSIGQVNFPTVWEALAALDAAMEKEGK